MRKPISAGIFLRIYRRFGSPWLRFSWRIWWLSELQIQPFLWNHHRTVQIICEQHTRSNQDEHIALARQIQSNGSRIRTEIHWKYQNRAVELGSIHIKFWAVSNVSFVQRVMKYSKNFFSALLRSSQTVPSANMTPLYVTIFLTLNNFCLYQVMIVWNSLWFDVFWNNFHEIIRCLK